MFARGAAGRGSGSRGTDMWKSDTHTRSYVGARSVCDFLVVLTPGRGMTWGGSRSGPEGQKRAEARRKQSYRPENSLLTYVDRIRI
eukprot:5462228-Prymnesium_polylepis.2